MNTKFWKAVFAAWVAASVVLFFGNILLAEVYAGLWRYEGLYGGIWLEPQSGLAQISVGQHILQAIDGNIASGVIINDFFYFLSILLAVYIMAEFIEKLSRAKKSKPLKYGAQLGILYSIPVFTQYFYFSLPAMVAVNAVVINVAAFIAAAFVYSKLDA